MQIAAFLGQQFDCFGLFQHTLCLFDDFLAYRDHPEHQRILKELIGPNLANRIVVQLQS
jgi:hypothetical protein